MTISVELLVKKILANLNLFEVPVPVEMIAEQSGIRIRYAPSADYSGILIRKEGGALMGINSMESPNRRRFTIAHELGHFFLERTTAVAIDYRDNTTGPVKSTAERRADEFAANLLMPKDFIGEDFRLISKSKFFLEEDLVELSSKYRVSREAMMWRLVNLGLYRRSKKNAKHILL